MKAVLFDMDGVIIDSHSVAGQLLHEAANNLGCNLSVKEIQLWGSLSSRQFWQKIKQEFKLSQDITELIHTYDVDREINLYREIGLVAGVRKLLEDLKEHGIYTALATSASRKRMNAVLDIFSIEQLFDKCLCDEDVSVSKPDPEIYLKACSELALKPNECVVIEDSTNGKTAAHQAGMKCIGFKGLKHVNEDMSGCELIIDDFGEIDTHRLRSLFQ
ncbi:haloacid dehalogenase superfamily, subfamily IA, variant 3 with third motif having DD or ED/haloacid dehalogenase superfamily, subfamily IA, variant 1 with third motif having Dx(3-4)D or Dx(3-4)E [Paenibacillus sp. 1_12]|uniref:HAD family hydrolase n=1 Tax=Paenibacillus sp. 1_12 TaxID=1566278 RepID=UPI0008F1B786|nr:HAD-IA family hydrolase [Paenibacillus sp. 1_12]SFM18485.1 haloacid dehalogenase superfamily, subfamily IA, variant 3 with third motif having DD or ED/haloacid dehalogenase superfamily, subfamily IA, variant 1 with third motif having Dx(3-4)D or Dx(3-4)E [Paenibacillus sp. 1_12]